MLSNRNLQTLHPGLYKNVFILLFDITEPSEISNLSLVSTFFKSKTDEFLNKNFLKLTIRCNDENLNICPITLFVNSEKDSYYFRFKESIFAKLIENSSLTVQNENFGIYAVSENSYEESDCDGGMFFTGGMAWEFGYPSNEDWKLGDTWFMFQIMEAVDEETGMPNGEYSFTVQRMIAYGPGGGVDSPDFSFRDMLNFFSNLSDITAHN